MKAVILAGGMGTRGRPYTEYFPKPMMPVFGRPLIDHIIRYVERFDFVSGTVIIADYEGLGGQIRNYYQNHAGKKITFVQDSQSGTGGDLLHAKAVLGRDKEFVLWFADNLCAADLGGMTARLRENKSAACVATRTRRKEETGFALVDGGIVKKFTEKPTMKLQMAECLGIYVIGMEVLKRISAMKKKDVNLSYDILQDLAECGMVSAFDIGRAGWIDAESPALLERNKKTVRAIIKEMGR